MEPRWPKNPKTRANTRNLLEDSVEGDFWGMDLVNRLLNKTERDKLLGKK